MESKRKRGMKIGALQLPSRPLPPPPPPPPPSATHSCVRICPGKPNLANAVSSLEASESEELQRLMYAPPSWKSKKRLSKQLSMCETARDIAWEKRRRQILRQERRRNASFDFEKDLTDEDLHELKGSIELGFGFNEEDGQQLCNTLPALDLYFAVNRQLSPVTSPRPTSTPRSQTPVSSIGGRSGSFDSPKSEESWKICSPGSI